MTYRRVASLVRIAVPLALVATAYAGGWAVATVRDMPEYALAGEPLDLTFMVRQHGISPLDGLEPRIAARLGADVVEARAISTKNTGEYAATMVLPRPGDGAFQILDAFGSYTLPQLTVIAPGSPAPGPLSQEALGERLFVAKGCIACHINREVQVENLVSIGPELTGRRFPETYLQGLLADPGAAFRRDSETEYGDMPNLDLTGSEVGALTAFINRERSR